MTADIIELVIFLVAATVCYSIGRKSGLETGRWECRTEKARNNFHRGGDR